MGTSLRHTDAIVAQLEELAAAIRRMPNQLFVQAFRTIELVLKVIQESTLYYVQRLPAELGSIAWTIDQKNRTITEMETTWSTLVLPMSEGSLSEPRLLWCPSLLAPCWCGKRSSFLHHNTREYIASSACRDLIHFDFDRLAGVEDVEVDGFLTAEASHVR